jgi:hypothetical protein
MLSNGISAPSGLLTGFNQPLGFAQSCSVDEDDALLFWRRIKEITQLRRHRFIPAHG